MSFDWGRMYKWEENHERNIDQDVEEYVCEHYEVNDIADLTEFQIKEIQEFVDEMNEHSVMIGGFYRLMNRWEDEHYEEE